MTMRELVWMARGKRVYDWGHTGNVLALLANVNRNPKKRRRQFAVYEFVPRDLRKEFRTIPGIRMTKSTLHALKPLFEKEGE